MGDEKGHVPEGVKKQRKNRRNQQPNQQPTQQTNQQPEQQPGFPIEPEEQVEQPILEHVESLSSRIRDRFLQLFKRKCGYGRCSTTIDDEERIPFYNQRTRYCIDHKCGQEGCYEPVYDKSPFCSIHRCDDVFCKEPAVIDVVDGQEYPEVFCEEHKKIYQTCECCVVTSRIPNRSSGVKLDSIKEEPENQ